MTARDEMLAGRPLPEITPLAEPFWSAAKQRRLVVQRCDDCSAYQFPPEVACVHCGAPRVAWMPASGRATLWSWTVGHPPLLPYFAERAPWPVAIVQLEEGPRMTANLIDVAVEEYEIGMALDVDFEEVSEDVTLPVFQRAGPLSS